MKNENPIESCRFDRSKIPDHHLKLHRFLITLKRIEGGGQLHSFSLVRVPVSLQDGNFDFESIIKEKGVYDRKKSIEKKNHNRNGKKIRMRLFLLVHFFMQTTHRFPSCRCQFSSKWLYNFVRSRCALLITSHL